MSILGVRAHDLGCFSADHLAKEVKRYGLNAVQLALGKAIAWEKEVDLSAYDEIKQAFSNNDVKITILSCYINPSIPDETLREAELVKFESYLRFAARVDAAVVGTETGSFLADCGPHPWNQSDEAFTILCQSVKRLVKTCEETGVYMGIEPVVRHVANSGTRLKQLIDHVNSPFIKVIFDPVNLLTEENYVKQEAVFTEALDLFGDRMVAVHLKDFIIENEKMTPASLGTGLLNLDFILKRCEGLDFLLDEVKKEEIPAIIARIKEKNKC